jgi:hypothetical protein
MIRIFNDIVAEFVRLLTFVAARGEVVFEPKYQSTVTFEWKSLGEIPRSYSRFSRLFRGVFGNEPGEL